MDTKMGSEMVFGMQKIIRFIILIIIIVNLKNFSIEKITIINWKDNHNTDSISLVRKTIDGMDWQRIGIVKE